ncbi:MAG: hypothetical protein WAT39_07920, partial [Planctomycetota bacterium]
MPTTDSDRPGLLRQLPSVDQILRLWALQSEPRAILAREARAWLDATRASVLAGKLDGPALAAQCTEVA